MNLFGVHSGYPKGGRGLEMEDECLLEGGSSPLRGEGFCGLPYRILGWVTSAAVGLSGPKVT